MFQAVINADLVPLIIDVLKVCGVLNTLITFLHGLKTHVSLKCFEHLSFTARTRHMPAFMYLESDIRSAESLPKATTVTGSYKIVVLNFL